MDGHQIVCAMSAVVMFVEALMRLRIDGFSVVLFGETAEVVKAPRSGVGRRYCALPFAACAPSATLLHA
jgi:hypothetical protein